MNRRKVTCPLTYFASGVRACRKPAVPLNLVPIKQVLPQGWFKIVNKPQTTMSGKTNILVNKEVRKSYGDDKFIRADDKFDAACAEESTARERLQKAGNLAGRVMGAATERREDNAEDNAARARSQPARKHVEQVTGEVKTIFGRDNGWDNESAPPSSPCTLGVTEGADLMMTQQATTLTAGGNALMARTTEHNLHRALMEGTHTLHNTGMGGNKMGGNDRDSGSASGNTKSRATAICGEGGYGMVRADGGRENVWAGSDNAVVLEKTTEMAGRCLGVVNGVRDV